MACSFLRRLLAMICPCTDTAATERPAEIAMPLAQPLRSDSVQAPFLAGRNIEIMSGCFITDDCRIGANSYIGFNSHICRASIGRYASIANHVAIGMGEHHHQAISTSSMFLDDPYEQLTAAPCVIGHDVWIGHGAVIRRGVTIGNGAVVGALSFVNKDVPPFAIVAGIPARIIKYRFDPATIDRITASAWWEKDGDEAKSAIAELGSKVHKQ